MEAEASLSLQFHLSKLNGRNALIGMAGYATKRQMRIVPHNGSA